MTALPAAPDGWNEFRRLYGGSAAIDAVTTNLIEIVDAVGVPIIVLRRDFTVACFNRAAADALGLAPLDVGRSPRDISILSSLSSLDRWCAQVIRAEVPTQHDFRAGDRSFIIRVAPYTKSDGQIGGTVLTFTNVTAFRASIDQAIYEREYTKAVLNSVPDPLVVLDADLHVQTANRAFYLMFRVSREAIQGIPLSAVSKEALDLARLVKQLKETLSDGRDFEPIEIDCDLPESGRRTLSLHACQFALPGYPAHMVLLSLHDITNINFLVREMDHRSKNLLALVQATVRLTKADTVHVLKAAIDGRIRALSNVHTLLAQSLWSGADLRALVGAELSPYLTEGTSRAHIDGPDVTLEPRSAQSFAIVLHELATNAVKYGALSVPEGRIRVRWSHAANGKLVLQWVETDGPPVKPPTRQGFGTRVLDQAIRDQLSGEMRFDWRPEGLVCEIEVEE
ncbi:MAG: HWE histidine kinase domain-containing protein [Rhodomicrobium sp.]